MTAIPDKLSWSSPVGIIPGIGPKREQALKESGIRSVGQLLEWFPRKYIDRSVLAKIRDLQEGQMATVSGQILRAVKTRGRRPRFFVMVSDDTGFLTCTWFAGAQYISKRFKVGARATFTGKISFYNGFQMTHPDFELLEAEEDGPSVPVWPIYSTPQSWIGAGFESRLFRKWVRWALDKVEFKKSILPASVLTANQIPSAPELFKAIHFPPTLDAGKKAMNQFRFAELFLLSYALLKRKQRNTEGGRAVPESGQIKSAFMAKLPFELTSAQKKVLRELEADVFSSRRMNRLIQGDVGSGKTIVGVLAALHYLESGYQIAFMAPTEILAEQHYLTAKSYLEPLEIRVGMLTGSLKSPARKEIDEGIRNGTIQFAVGTHALLSKTTEFHKIGLIVVDEQHRFGVEQRLSLYKKGDCPDVLVMSATPIPRTVALVLYGDLDISVIDEKPPGRKEIVTRMVPENKRRAMYQFIRNQVSQGYRTYVILPLVDESAQMEDVTSATETAALFRKKIFPDLGIGLLHGRLKGEEKHSVMESFRSGKTPILVSTTVVEVGMDVREAGIMVVEHAERFGLSQLHQLRGRIGRGKQDAYCFLLPSKDINEVARERLTKFCGTGDGFEIAEMDLELRGPGDLTGFRQSGFSFSGMASPFFSPRLFTHARAFAEKIISGEMEALPKEKEKIDKASENLLRLLRGESGAA